MTFEYCGECKKIMIGGYFASADKDVKLFLCRYCSGVTAIESKKYEFNLMDHDIRLRGEAIRLQMQYYKSC